MLSLKRISTNQQDDPYTGLQTVGEASRWTFKHNQILIQSPTDGLNGSYKELRFVVSNSWLVFRKLSF